MEHKTHSRGSNLSTTHFLIFTFLSLMFVASFNTTLENFETLGTMAIVIALTLSIFLLLIHYTKSKKVNRIHFSVIITSILYLSVLVIDMVNNFHTRSFITIYQFIGIVSFFMACSLITWDDKKKKIAKNIAIIFLLTLPFFGNTQFIGPYMVFVMFLLFLDQKKSLFKLLLITACLYIVYLSGMRGVYLLLASTLIIFVMWKVISKNRVLYITTFLSIIIGNIAFAFIYPNLIYWSHFYTINDFVFQYTDKRIMSGRNVIWENLIQKINEQPLLGYGTGSTTSYVSELDVSAHNLYLQTAMQNGYIGLFILLTLFFVIWLGFYRSKNEYATRLSASFFIGILVYQSFEVVLTQNKMDVSLIFWFMISVGVSHSIRKQQNN